MRRSVQQLAWGGLRRARQRASFWRLMEPEQKADDKFLTMHAAGRMHAVPQPRG